MRTAYSNQPTGLPNSRGAVCALVGVYLAVTPAAFAQNVQRNGTARSSREDAIEVHVGKGHEALKDNRYVEAVREFRVALELNPNLAVRARFPLAVALFNLQDRENARKEFEALRSEAGDDPNVMYYLGRLDLMGGNVDGAIRKLTVAVSKPPFPDTAYYLGFAYFRKRDMAHAEEWLHKAAEVAPRDFRVEERLGLLYRATGRKEEAEKAFARSSELHEQDTLATEEALTCGRSLDTQPLQQAKTVCQKLFDTDDISKLVTLGTLYGGHGYYIEALEPFQRAAELDPDSYEMQYNLGLTYFRLKRYAEARAPLEKAVTLRPDLFELNAPLGTVLYALGDDPAAYRVLRHAHKLNPQNAEIGSFLFKVATSLAQKNLSDKEYAVAVQYLREAAELHPCDPEPHRRLADAYASMGNQSQAEKERREVARLSGAK